MKSIRTLPRAAFTLIELLVVISIIALLASIAVPTANTVMRKAKEVQARALMTGLIMGIKNYQTEYNRFPDPKSGGGGAPTAADAALNQGDSSESLIPILHPDQSQPGPALNPRRIACYDPPPAKNGANGLTTNGELADPWSSPTGTVHAIYVGIDYSGDGAIDSNVDPTKSGQDIQTSVIAWCTGQPLHPPSENDGSDPAASKYFLCSWK